MATIIIEPEHLSRMMVSVHSVTPTGSSRIRTGADGSEIQHLQIAGCEVVPGVEHDRRSWLGAIDPIFDHSCRNELTARGSPSAGGRSTASGGRFDLVAEPDRAATLSGIPGCTVAKI
jgi:hypothetical protein